MSPGLPILCEFLLIWSNSRDEMTCAPLPRPFSVVVVPPVTVLYDGGRFKESFFDDFEEFEVDCWSASLSLCSS